MNTVRTPAEMNTALHEQLQDDAASDAAAQRQQDVDDLADALSALDRDGGADWSFSERATFLIEYMNSEF